MSSLNGIGVGIPYATYEGTGSITDSSTFYAPLETSLILKRGTGDPTWSRATKAWGFNELGYLEELASGCAFFGGARLVRNLAPRSEVINSGWTLGGTTTPDANTLLESAGGTTHQCGSPITTLGTYLLEVWMKRGAGSTRHVQLEVSGTDLARVSFNLDTGAVASIAQSGTLSLISYGADADVDASGYRRFYIRIHASASASNTFYPARLTEGLNGPISYSGDGTSSVLISKVKISDVTNYDASYIPEYVSVGVVASPFFGAGIDGAKYFETDWQGAPIAAANLLGFRREAAATNNLLQSRKLTVHHAGSVSTKRWQSTTPVGAEVVLNSSFDSGLTNWATTIGSGGSISVAGGQCTFVSDGGTATYMTNAATLTVGSTYVLETIATGTGSVKLVNGAQEIAGFGTGTTTISFVAASTAITIYRISGTPCNIVFDSISIKLSSVQCSQTATGLDGIANPATTLTATAADAIILQPITLASAARCASAYVKRRTGTGTISFTQDGGSTWTDITAQINSSTWSRVQITATLANPSVGFKISTSGDAIDVDCAQNEAGAVATSPIVTTTATVTRNADSLTYQTASNIDFAVGTVYCETQFTAAISTRRAVAIGADGHSYINTGDANTIWKAYDGTNIVTKSGLSDISTAKRKRVVTWGTGMSVTGDGLTPASGLFDGAFGSGATIDVGNTINGYIGPVAIWNYQMTDAQLQAITL